MVFLEVKTPPTLELCLSLRFKLEEKLCFPKGASKPCQWLKWLGVRMSASAGYRHCYHSYPYSMMGAGTRDHCHMGEFCMDNHNYLLPNYLVRQQNSTITPPYQ